MSLINKETSESSGDLVEYPMKKKAQPRETLPRGTKTPTNEVTTLKKTIRMKQPSTSPPHSASSFENNKNTVSEYDAGAEELSSYEIDLESESVREKDVTPIDIQQPPQPP